jgi:anti-anti-sigma regulatory factor
MGMDKVEIRLPAQLDMAALPGLKEELEAAALSANALRIDGSDVERVGTPAIQLLLAAAKAFSGEGRSFALEASSHELSSALDDLGLGLDTCQWSVP